MAIPWITIWHAAGWSGDESAPRAHRASRADSAAQARTRAEDVSRALAALSGDDAALVRAVRDGDTTALERIHRTHWLPLVRAAARLTRSADVARDIVQDVFADLWARRAEWLPYRSIATHLHRAVRNRALHVVRDAATEARWTGPTPPKQWTRATHAPSPAEELSARDLTSVARATVEALPPRSREAYLLYLEQRLEIPDIAAVMGIAESTAQLQLKRAMAALRAALERAIGPDSP